MSTIYEPYAPYYDGSGQLRFAILFAQYLGDLLVRHPVEGRRALDLACGTGTLAVMLADAGWDVVGLDASHAMLALACEKAAMLESPGSATFVQGDMRNFADGGRWMVDGDASSFTLHPSSFDLVTCSYDSVNYLLSEADVLACFQNIACALAPNGLFVADMNTRYFLEHDWEPVIISEREGLIQIEQSHFDPTTDCSTLALTGFAGDDMHGYQRFDEVHVERAYPPETVAALLEQAGLRLEAAYDCFTLQPYYERSQRIAWIARKAQSSEFKV